MSTYSQKLFRKEIPTAQDWESHLIEAHSGVPSMTPRVFSQYTTENGINSYQVLANVLEACPKPIERVLDLGCGDGYLGQYIFPHLGKTGKLVGVDMVEAEIGLAQRTVQDPRASFFCARAQTLPVADQSLDAVLCHMAFMLMSPVDPVVAELGRVLKSGGKFSAVVGGLNAKGHGLLNEIQSIIFKALDREMPSIKSATTGDPRTRTNEGLVAIFQSCPAFRDKVDILDFEIRVHSAADGVWDFFKDMYFVDMLPEKSKTALRLEVIAFVESKSGSDGKSSFLFPMRRFTVFRA